MSLSRSLQCGFVLVLACLAITSVAAIRTRQQPAAGSLEPAAPVAAAAANPNDVHIHVAGYATNKVDKSDSLIGLENKFLDAHSTIMSRLNKVLRRVTQTVNKNPKVSLDLDKECGDNEECRKTYNSLLEVEADPIIDDTGSLAGAPQANLTQYNVKPTIDPELRQDYGASAFVETEGVPVSDDDNGESDGAPAFIETTADPIIDDTGSIETGAPTANLTQYNIKPTIDPELRQDYGASAFVETEGVPVSDDDNGESDGAPAFVEHGAEAETESETESESESESEVEGDEASPIIDGTGSDAETPKANPEQFKVKPTIDPELRQDYGASSFLEMAEEPIIDDTGSDSFTPTVNLTQFSVKPTIDPSLVQDKDAVSAFLEIESTEDPIIDDTGSLAGAPQANLTQYNVKPTIDPELRQDYGASAFVETEGVPVSDDDNGESDGAPAFLEEEAAPIVDNTGSYSDAPTADLKKYSMKPTIDASLAVDAPQQPEHKSLLEMGDCPTCKKGAMRQDHPIVYSNGVTVNSLDRPLIEEQHNAINYLIKPVADSLSIKERHLTAAKEQIRDASGILSDVAEFKEKMTNEPLIPHHLQN